MTEEDPTRLEQLAERVKRRSAGEWDALRECWNDEVIIWHCYDNEEQRIAGLSRSSGASAELVAFGEALDDFRRSSIVHVSALTNTIIETSVWTGRTKSGTDMSNATCVVYAVVGDKIARMDIYDDGNRSRRFAEVLVHHLIASRAT